MKQQSPKPHLLKLAMGHLIFFCTLLGGCASMHGGSNLQTPVLPGGQQHIALMLPLSGSLGNTGQAIRNGFLAAYYEDKQHNSNVPTVTVLDTEGNANNTYQQAVNNGANYVVGPLTKEQVQSLAKSDVSVPTLALNTLPANEKTPLNLYQFALSPKDEADQVAQRAWQNGHRNAIIIAPAGAWGQGVAQEFSQRWQSLGGGISDSLAFTPGQDMSKAIGNLLQVSPDITKQLKKAAKEEAQGKIRGSDLRRQDFDMIFLVASPQQGRTIKPFLNFYFAGNIPVYATSSIYSGTPSPQTDRDLDGIVFCDMPWVLENPMPGNVGALQSRIAALWPSSASYAKFYAMGIDAYALITNLQALNNGSSLSEATGILSLNSQHQVYRQLLWAQMRRGVPVLL